MGSTAPKIQVDYDSIVVGGGFSGVYQLQSLRKRGFKTHLFEASSGLGGVWFNNTYPGARVDTAVPVYQLTDQATMNGWNWKQSYPGQAELCEYFKHVDKVWGLSQDVSYNCRVTSMAWDEANGKWDCEINDGERKVTAWTVVLCTGMASKRYDPKFKNVDSFKGQIIHAGAWPKGLDVTNKRVGIIGTGASGVQVIQEVSKTAKKLSVFQRTPNTALPMKNLELSDLENQQMKETYDELNARIRKTLGGFDYEFYPHDSTNFEELKRHELYEKLYNSGGLHFWLANYQDTLEKEGPNEEAYQYWRSKVHARVKDPKIAELLAPGKKLHYFGVKRVSLERQYFEVYNQDNVELVSIRDTHTPIQEFVPEGIKTSDGRVHELDILIQATGFDSVTGGITQMNITGKDGLAITDKWSNGVFTHLGMMTNQFPNMFFIYGPQTPTVMAVAPLSAEAQGEWLIELLDHMRKTGVKTIENTIGAEEEWREHVNQVAAATLYPTANSWYFGANIPGKRKEALLYLGGLPLYRQKCWEVAQDNYRGFVMAH